MFYLVLKEVSTATGNDFTRNIFPLSLQLRKYFHWPSCSYLEILWIGILINRTVPLTSLLTLCILECVYAPPRLRVTQQLIRNKISRITEASSVIKAGIFLAAIKSFEALPDIIQLAVEDPAGRRNCVAPVDQTGESLNYNYSSRGEERREGKGMMWWYFKLLTLNIEQPRAYSMPM